MTGNPPKKIKRQIQKKLRAERKQRKRLRKKTPRISIGRRLGGAIDNLIYLFAPQWGSRRIRARQGRELFERRAAILSARLESLTRHFDGASDSDLRNNWLVSGQSPDAGLEDDLPELQERCSHLYRNNSIAHSAVEGRVTNEVGVGISVQSRVRPVPRRISQSNAMAINQLLEERFERLSDYGLDTRRQLSISQAQKLVCRSFASHGEAFVVLGNRPMDEDLVSMTFEIVSPERVESPPDKAGDPSCKMGVQYSSDEKTVLGYWVRDTHPGDDMPTLEYTYYPKYDAAGQPVVLHVFDPLFPGQSRGFPWLAAAMNRIKDLDDFLEAELVAKQIEACFGLIFRGGPDSQAPIDVAESNATDTGTGSSTFTKRLEEISPGMIHYAGEGEDVTTIDPNRPGANFQPFLENMLRLIAASLNYPYELLAKNFFRTTFSSGQLAMLDGRLGFKMRQKVLVEKFCKPIWKRFVFENVFLDEVGGLVDLLDYTANPSIYERHVWQAQGWGYINPRDEVRANTLELESDTTTLSAIYAGKGLDAEEQLKKRLDEKLEIVRQEVEVRKAKWELEERYGLPHETSEGQSQVADEEPEPAFVE